MARPDKFSVFDDDAQLGASSRGTEKTTKEEETVPKSRLDQVIAERDAERQGRDNLVLGMLNRESNANGAANEEEEVTPADLIEDEEVREVLSPALLAAEERGAKRAIEMFQQQYGAVLEKVVQDSATGAVGETLGLQDGIPPELMKEVKAEFWNLPDGTREKYDNEVGLELLARRVLDKQGASRRSDELGDMAHSAPFGSTPPAAPRGAGVSDEDAFAMTPEQWDEYKRELHR